MKRASWVLSLFLFLSSGLPAIAQSRSDPWAIEPVSGQRIHQNFSLPPEPDQDDEYAKAQKENGRRANAERQLAIKNDTAKLLQMANELQEYVDKTNENILSIEVVKKAEQIEKLARTVKEKMKANH